MLPASSLRAWGGRVGRRGSLRSRPRPPGVAPGPDGRRPPQARSGEATQEPRKHRSQDTARKAPLPKHRNASRHSPASPPRRAAAPSIATPYCANLAPRVQPGSEQSTKAPSPDRPAPRFTRAGARGLPGHSWILGVDMNAPLTPAQRAALESVQLDDKYTLETGRAWMSGIHALVRLPMMQRVRDQRAGLNTAGFISGYRGSPLGGVDLHMWKAAKYLKAHHVEFQPGINEDLAATAVWGSQQVNLFPGARYDGVFGMWYGKGPGVDRCGDVFKHANAAGTSPHGGVLVVAGDDHPAKSSTLPHQSDLILKACMIPVLFP